MESIAKKLGKMQQLKIIAAKMQKLQALLEAYNRQEIETMIIDYININYNLKTLELLEKLKNCFE